MGCAGCESGRGHYNTQDGIPKGCQSNGSCGTGGCNKLNVFDWLANMKLPEGNSAFDVVEVRFKNSRKAFFKNVNLLPLQTGDVVAVESSPGHDIGVVSTVGEIVKLQLKKNGVNYDSEEIKKIYRKAKKQDIEKWKEAQELEHQTMHKARTLAIRHGLQMKISDVEYQGDKTKAVFYYTADERVDFRELIKTMAEEFKIRIEMKQIGARQEASRLGGLGACGRELCCSTWLTDFRSVSTSAARYQQLSLNPLKLAGQCGKLKCCLNYELDSYMDAIKDFPSTDNLKLKTARGIAYHQKTDIFRRTMWFTFADEPDNFIAVDVDRVKFLIQENKSGNVPESLTLQRIKEKTELPKPDYSNVVGQDSITRFDKKKKHNGPRKSGTEQKATSKKQEGQPKSNQPKHRKPNFRKNNPGKGNNNPSV